MKRPWASPPYGLAPSQGSELTAEPAPTPLCRSPPSSLLTSSKLAQQWEGWGTRRSRLIPQSEGWSISNLDTEQSRGRQGASMKGNRQTTSTLMNGYLRAAMDLESRLPNWSMRWWQERRKQVRGHRKVLFLGGPVSVKSRRNTAWHTLKYPGNFLKIHPLSSGYNRLALKTINPKYLFLWLCFL